MVGSNVVGGNAVGGNVDADADAVVAAALDFSVRRGVVSSFSCVVGLISVATSSPPDFHTTKCH